MPLRPGHAQPKSAKLGFRAAFQISHLADRHNQRLNVTRRLALPFETSDCFYKQFATANIDPGLCFSLIGYGRAMSVIRVCFHVL